MATTGTVSGAMALKNQVGRADEPTVMADVQFAPPLQRLTSPPTSAPIVPPPAPAAIPAPLLRLTTPAVAPVRENAVKPSTQLPSFMELLQTTKPDVKPAKHKKKRSKKLPVLLVVLGLAGGAGYYFRNSAPVQKVLGKQQQAAPLPDVAFVRPNVTSADYSVTLSAVQNGVPNKVTTHVLADYAGGMSQTTIDSRVGGAFNSVQEIRTREFIFRPGTALGVAWTRQPQVPETPNPYDAAVFIPMINDIVDQPLRDATEPTSSKSETVEGATTTTLTYVLDRASVPEIAPAIFARIPWLFDVPNATTLTVEVAYDESGIVRHLFFGVDPPQPGTGSDATWITSYSMDVSSVDAPVAVTVPTDALDVPVGTP